MDGAVLPAGAAADTLVLGVGNPLFGDDGFGVRAVEALQQRWHLPPSVQVLDGGTQGLYLLPALTAVRRLLILDALDLGLAPGTLSVLRDGDIPRAGGMGKMDVHQMSMQDVLAAAALLDRCPETAVLIGVQPAQLDGFGQGLSTTVAGRLDDAVTWAVATLESWGIWAEPRRDVAGVAKTGIRLADVAWAA